MPVLLLWLCLTPPLAAQPELRMQMLEQRRERLQARREQQFREADLDNDRRLAPTEIENAGLPHVLLERFAEIDVDGDGGLSPEELQALQQRRVQQATAGSGDAGHGDPQ